ncbi:TonB-dependent receptor [Sphingomonas sp. SM33]|uniref:TonB-dependent receptor n=1 Tax=Sphingomonas telluris TaxID=2907998 RepID=A0ABS9VJU9_9SPHN|nr:TonB-dependent receptor [Sphingomonas telluris]MCH8615268.1 TonB-dependent receptor [Sphingomonas telluris]
MLNASLRGRRALLLAGTSILFATSGTAFAQDTQPADTAAQQAAAAQQDADTAPTPGDADVADQPGAGEIVVTGIRRGLQSSIDTKRREQGIVEAVSAEDIGKLPDISIAESIARLPGLAAQRVNGRAQSISIRGLAPDFTTTLLNGRQQASSGDNRAVEFDQYPSELLSSVVIYKTPDANIAGFGLSGTADLRTVRPLTFKKTTFAVNVRGELNGGGKLNDDVKDWGGRASASYISKITPELGIALGVAYLDSPSSNRHTKAYNYETFCCGPEQQISPAGAQDATFLTGQEIFATSRTNKRLAGIGIIEWEPSDKVHTIVDLYYSRFKQRETMRGAQWFSNVWLGEQTFTNVVTEDRDGTEVAVTGTANNVTPIIRNDYNKRDDWLFSAGLNNEYKFTDELSLISDLSYSRNKRVESVTETYAGYGCCATGATEDANRAFDSISWDLTGNGFLQYDEGLNYGDANQVSLGDRAPWGGWGHDGLTKSPHVKEEIFAIDEGVRYQPVASAIEAIDVGFNWTSRDKRKHVDEFDMNLKNGRLQTLVDPDFVRDATSLGFAGFGNVLAYDVPDVMDRYYDFTPTEDSAHFDKAWKIKEDVLTLKARAQFAFGGLHGNIGLQGVHQKQESTGQRINFIDQPPTITEVTEGDSYWDWLPSLNAYYDFGGGHRLRFAASKVLARPRMDEMRANLTPGFNDQVCGGSPPCAPGQEVHPWSGSGGNPNLQPWRAKALDVSYEWYIGPASYIAVAAFYKKLDNYIYTRVLPFDFSAFPPPSTASNIPDDVVVSPIGTITMPDNGPGGKLWGFELSGALELKRLASFLDGFGVLGSYSKTKSNLNPTDNSGEDVRIPGLSGTVYNLTGYYEKYGFQARISYRYRSPFKGEVVQLFTNRGFTQILADKQVDAQVGYDFAETSDLKGFGVLFQVYNLTNSPYRTRIGLDQGGPTTANGGTFIETYEKYGRQYLLGFNYKF